MQPEQLAKVEASMVRARARLITDHPFFGDLALRLRLQVDTTCRDMWTDGRTLGFNPLWVDILPEAKLTGALAHEVLHIVFGHHVRRKDRDKTLWNRACDLAINSILIESGFHLPDGFLYNVKYTNMKAEEIYALLLDEISSTKQERSGQKGEQSHGDKSSQVDENVGKNGAPFGLQAVYASAEDGKGKEEEDRERSKQEGRGVKPVAGQKSSGKKKDGETMRFDGEVRDLPSLDAESDAEAARKAAERDAEITLNQALHRAKNMGTLPAGVERQVKEQLPRSLDWRELLRLFLETCADSDYTWTSPNRRYVSQGIYMPSRWEQRLQHVVMAVDSSGSVDEPMLALFCSELRCVLEFFDTTLTVLFHDTKVHKVVTIGRLDGDLDIVPSGGGGTDFRPVPETIESLGLKPTCLIWFTDLECDLFPAEPGYPVLWICPEHSGEKPPFGEVVFMNE